MVDRLGVRVVVDGYHDAIARSMKVGAVEVQRVGVILGASLQKHLHSEHGLSLHLESQRGGEKRNFLLDFGFTPGALFNNLDILKIDSATLDALIVSHGHFDHFGGLVPFLKRDPARMHKDLALYAGGEDTFCYRWNQLPDGQRDSFGVLDRRDLSGANVRVIMADKPAVIEGQAFTTGAIPRAGFEKVLPATRVGIGVRDGAGCDASHFTKEEEEGEIVFDQFYGEHATCFNVKDRGLVVISSCGHAGLINSIRQAQAVSGVQKVHAAGGGLSSFPSAGTLHPTDRAGAQGTRSRLHHPHALQWCGIYPDDAEGDAGQAHRVLYWHAFDLPSLTGQSAQESTGVESPSALVLRLLSGGREGRQPC